MTSNAQTTVDNNEAPPENTGSRTTAETEQAEATILLEEFQTSNVSSMNCSSGVCV